MVNLKSLRLQIDESGMKITALCDKAGISRRVLYHKLRGRGDFTASEIKGLADALHLTTKDRDRIFFANEVVSDTTEETQ